MAEETHHFWVRDGKGNEVLWEAKYVIGERGGKDGELVKYSKVPRSDEPCKCPDKVKIKEVRVAEAAAA